MARYKSWDEIRGELALTDDDVAGYARLDEAERRLYEARRRRGITDAEMAEALGIDEHRTWSVDHDDDLYLFALARYVAAAGGRLEVRAVFDDEEVVLLRDPELERV
jgi:hypothetical protein